MARWHFAGDTEFDPAPLPSPRDACAYVVHGGEFFLLGGWNLDYSAELNGVISYNPNTNAWSARENLGFESEFYNNAVSDGTNIYVMTPAGVLHEYDPAIGSTVVGSSGVAGYQPLVLVGGKIYCGLASPNPRYYDLLSETWHDAPGTSPFVSTINYAAAIPFGNNIVITAGHSGEVWLFDPTGGNWSALPAQPEPAIWAILVEMYGRIYQIGGELDGGVGALVTYSLAPNLSEWEGEDSQLVDGIAGHSAGALLGRVFIAGGYDYTTLVPTDGVAMFGDSFSYLTVTASVPLPDNVKRNEASLSLSADIVGGPGASTSITLSLVTGGRESATDLEIGVDVGYPEGTIIPPLVGNLGDGGTIIVPGEDSGVEEIHEYTPGMATSYSFSHGLGRGATGQAESPFKGEFGIPGHVPVPPVFIAHAGYSWSYGGEIRYKRLYADSGAETALNITRLGELMPVDQIDKITNGTQSGICLFPLDAPLCDGVGVNSPITGTTPAILEQIMPTAAQIARQAASAAGVGLTIMNGPGLYEPTRRVPITYRTEGRTAMEVISELLVTGGVRYWYQSGTLVIDGRKLPTGSLGSAPPGTPESAQEDFLGGIPGNPEGPGGDGENDQGFPQALPYEGSIIHDHGMEQVTVVRFASSQSQGFLTPAQVRDMIQMYESGDSFTLSTDLMGPLGNDARVFSARFDPDSVPQFTAATGYGDLYYFDFALLIEYEGEGEGGE